MHYVQSQARSHWCVDTNHCIFDTASELNLLEGENNTFVGGEDYLRQRGIEVVVLENAECEELMKKFIKEKPGDWCVPRASFDHNSNCEFRNEDIGEEKL